MAAETFFLLAPDASGALPIDDAGQVAASPSRAVALAVWTLRTPYGASPSAPTRGTRWSAVEKTREDAVTALREVLRAALRWIVDAGFAQAIGVETRREGPRALGYTIEITEPDGAVRTIEGTA